MHQPTPVHKNLNEERSLSLRERIRSYWADHGWLLIGVAAILVYALGILGFRQYYESFAQPKIACTGGDLAYMSFQLFRLGSVVPVGPKPWLLELARALATIITLTAAIKALMLFFHEKLQRLRLLFWSNHIVICGLGEKGKQLALDLLKQRKQVVIIDVDEKNEKTRHLTEKGAIVFTGNATDAYLLKKARLRHARRLFAVCGDDWVNLDIALLAHHLMTADPQNTPRWLEWLNNLAQTPGLRALFSTEGAKSTRSCFVHLINTELRDLLARHRVLSKVDSQVIGRVDEQVIINCFNIYENAARQLFRVYPPEVAALQRKQKTVHILLIGFGQMGRSVALQIAKAGHYAHGQRVRFTVVDKFAEKKRAFFLHTYPMFKEICDLDFVSLDTDDKGFLNGSFLGEKGGPDSVTQAIVCLENESAAYICALNLLHLFRDSHCQILVRVTAETKMVCLLAADQSEIPGLNDQILPIHAFGCIASSCSADLVVNDEIDEMARQMHASYFRLKIEKGDDPANDVSMKPWDQLSEDLKDSNRQQAEHLEVKLRAVGCKLAEPVTGQAAATFTFEEIELLAEMEHARWNAERFLAGWTPGEHRDPIKKVSPHLKAWKEIDEPIKDYDRNTVIKLPDMLTYEKIRRVIVRDDSAKSQVPDTASIREISPVHP
ncbi:NAD-binding protein [Desulfobulbus sp.]|uniref:NAD-binding protein n=1 Tax=Desulfobulbus sp. TaxID=895 RepID=UPI00286F227C|nr:NAD-binding protein [Desulfobulbus sp.]